MAVEISRFLAARLFEWARANRDDTNSLLGYSSPSYDDIYLGGRAEGANVIACKQTRPAARVPRVEWSRAVEEIDAVIRRIEGRIAYGSEVRLALFLYHVDDRHQDSKADSFRRATGRSRRTFYRRLRHGHEHVGRFVGG